MALIHEEIYRYAGYQGCQSHCRVRVYQQSSGAMAVVFSELDGELAHLDQNPGTSITNVAEQLATAWRHRYRDVPLTA